MTDAFDAHDDEGNRYVIHIRRSYIKVGTLDGPSRIEGLPSFYLSGGSAVNRIDNRTFEIVATKRGAV